VSLIGLAFLVVTEPAADSTESAQYSLDAAAFPVATALENSSASYRMDWTAGELAIGGGSSASYQVSFGFWPACNCPCGTDPVCDGVTNVLDVVGAINVGFRGALSTTDPDCPYPRTDANCDGITDVLDVVRFVNVTFRGGDPATEFCSPCGL
jgi:hypothetical protein